MFSLYLFLKASKIRTMLHIFDQLIFHYFWHLIFSLIPLQSPAKSKENYGTLFLSWMPLINFVEFGIDLLKIKGAERT